MMDATPCFPGCKVYRDDAGRPRAEARWTKVELLEAYRLQQQRTRLLEMRIKRLPKVFAWWFKITTE